MHNSYCLYSSNLIMELNSVGDIIWYLLVSFSWDLQHNIVSSSNTVGRNKMNGIELVECIWQWELGKGLAVAKCK